MKEKINMKRRILIGLILLSITFLCFPVKSFISGSWTDNDLESITSHIGFTSGNSNNAFYCEENDRWYVLYNTEFYLRYSYSDEGDISSMNSGGVVWVSPIGDDNAANDLFSSLGNWFSWAYDEIHDIGHVFWCHNEISGTADLLYRNFTLNVGGSLDFGSVKTLYDDVYGANNKIFVNMALDENNLPLLVTTGYYDDMGEGIAVNFWVWKPSSYEVYGATWQVIKFDRSTCSSRSSLAIIPMGGNEVLVVVVNVYVDEPLYSCRIDFDTASNGSVTLSSGFSDESVKWEYMYDTTRNRCALWGFTYNSTHACFVYTDANDMDIAYAFIYTFIGAVKSDEYICLDASQEIFPDVTIHNNEFFVFGYGEGIATGDDTLYGNEYSNGGSSPFNTTHQTTLFTMDDFNLYQPNFSVPLFSNDDGEMLILFADDDANSMIDYSYGTILGEFSENGDENGDVEYGEFDFWFFKWILALVVFIVIISFAIYVKGGNK